MMKIEFLKVQFKENRFMQKYCKCTFILNKADLVPPNSKLHNPTEPTIDNGRILKFKGYFLSVIFHLPSCILTKIENTMQH